MIAELFHADGQADRQTDTMKLIGALHNFENAPENQSGSSVWVNSYVRSEIGTKNMKPHCRQMFNLRLHITPATP